jgi:hypothetical protein
MKTKYMTLFAITCASAVQGAPRNSTIYSVAAEAVDSGGRRTTSANYTHDGSVGLIAGVSSVSSPTETAKAGYVSQLYDVTGLMLTAFPSNVDETATRQLYVRQTLDDASYLDISASSVAWSVVTGPITGVSATGVAVAGMVYQDSAATVKGGFAGLSALLDLTVLNTLPDNYGSYAGDGLDDSWQFQYFGLNNPDASPLMDPDADGQDNSFEFLAGIVPTDPGSRFTLRVESVSGQSAQKRLVFSPRWVDRSYHVVTSATLEASSWAALTGGDVIDSGTERSVTDTSASTPAKFYRVEINKP